MKLVLNEKVLSCEEFFNLDGNFIRKLENSIKSDEEINEILRIINFDKVKKEGKEMILFTDEDKRLFLDYFPEINR